MQVDFWGRGWGDSDGPRLAAVLKKFYRLETLSLGCNRFSLTGLKQLLSCYQAPPTPLPEYSPEGEQTGVAADRFARMLHPG